MLEYAFNHFLGQLNKTERLNIHNVSDNTYPDSNPAPLRTYGWASYGGTVTVCSDGSLAIAKSNDCGHKSYTMDRWDVYTGQCLQRFSGTSGNVTRLAVLPDGSLLGGVSEYIQNRCFFRWHRWNSATGEIVQTFDGFGSRMAVLPNGSVVTGGASELQHWDPLTGECLKTFGERKKSIASSPTSGLSFGYYEDLKKSITHLIALPDGTVVSGYGGSRDSGYIEQKQEDTTLQRWDPQTGKCLQTFHPQGESVVGLSALPDGTFVSGSTPGRHDKQYILHRWDPSSGQCIQTFYGNEEEKRLVSLAALPDGSLVSVSQYGRAYTLHRWDPYTTQRLQTIHWNSYSGQPMESLVPLKDGSMVMTYKGTLEHWPAGGSTLTLAQLEKTLEALQQNTTITSLSLTQVEGFTDKALNTLIEMVKSHPALTSLTLHSCGLHEAAVTDLLAALQSASCKVVHVDFSESAASQARLLSQATERRLRQAVQDRGKVKAPDKKTAQEVTTSPSAPTVAPEPLWTQAQTEDLQGLLNNTLFTLDWSGRALSELQVLGLGSALSRNASLQVLSLEETRLSSRGVQTLCQVLNHHKTLGKLVLNENPMGEEGVASLLALFSKHPSLYKVSASVATGATKAQRELLKQANRQCQHRKQPKSESFSPSTATFFGCHGLHALVGCLSASAVASGYALAKAGVPGLNGDIFHGLVHLHQAVTLKNDKTAIDVLVKAGYMPRERDESGASPLMLALSQKKYALAHHLIPYSDVLQVDKEGNTLLHVLGRSPVSGERDRLWLQLVNAGVQATALNQAGESAADLVGANAPGLHAGPSHSLKDDQKQAMEAMEERIACLEQQVAFLLSQFESGQSPVKQEASSTKDFPKFFTQGPHKG